MPSISRLTLTGSRLAARLLRFLFLFRPRAGLLSVVVLLAAAPSSGQEAAPSQRRSGELVHLVRQDCGSCHGLTLKGGLGPALTAEALRDKPAASLIATVLGGRPGTPMPPFRGIVSDSEAAWIVERLQAGFPPL